MHSSQAVSFATHPPEPVNDGLRRTQTGWHVLPTCCDMLPEDAGVEFEEHIEHDSNTSQPEEAPATPGRHVVLLVTSYVRTVANTFGL